jgi:hypothetical protein
MSAEKRFRTIKNSSIPVLLDFGNKNTTNKPEGTIEENGVGKFNDFTPRHYMR